MRLPLAVAAAALGLAALSLALPSAPGYDPWAWLVWGREVGQGGLDTVDGPAFKPLPVGVDAVLWRLVGDGSAPDAWLVLARAAALAAVAAAARLAFVLSGGSRAAAALTGAGVLLTATLAENAAAGNAEGAAALLLALAVGAGLAGRPRAALALGAGLALLRPESWVGLLVYGLWVVRADRALRPWLAAGSVGVLVAWFVPELLGSGDLLRSGERAQLPNPGQPATAAVPGWAALRDGLGLPLLPLLLAGLAAPGRGRVPALLGLAWIAEVAVMAQVLGTSGEARYSLPGAVLLAVSGGVGVVALAERARRWGAAGAAAGRGARGSGSGIAGGAAGRGARGRSRDVAGVAVLGLLLALAAGARLEDTGAELRRAGDGAELAGTLAAAIRAAGGRERVLACGPPVVGRYRGPMTAWALGVPRSAVRTPGGRGGVALRSRIRRGAPLQPAAPPGARLLGRSPRWVLEGACATIPTSAVGIP